jgi:Ser/Thr protein kinase RdoA (MazF antagonist)
MTQPTSRTAEIRTLAKAGNGEAERLLADLLRDLFTIEARNVAINHDQYSLNSLNGFFETDDGAFFFKFHQEEGEEAMSGEYYRADILAKAGLPVDQPLLMSVLPGEQILVYRRRTDPRFSDVLRALDMTDDAAAREKAVKAERALSEAVLKVYLDTLHPVNAAEVAAEPIHRLFYERLIDPPEGAYPGGRLSRFYVGEDFAFPGLTLGWDRLSRCRFVVNGIEYEDGIGALFDAAHERLAPARLADAGGVVAHGDAHNANVWYEERGGSARLAFFDPAFAGENIPTLLAEVKTTFHNILAHPFWLYDPAEASARYKASAVLDGDRLNVTMDFEPSPVRRALLEVKAEALWRPLLATLKARDMLPADWRRVVRLGLFLCPTLVMNLRAGATSHNPVSSLIGLSVAVMAGSEPVAGEDVVSRFLDAIDPGRG